MRFFCKILKYISFFCLFFVIGIIIFIYVYFFIRSKNVLTLNFLLDTPRGSVLGEEGGIFPAIIGSLYFSSCALLISFIPAISVAIYLSFYAKSNIKKIFHTVIENLQAFPSIVLGLFSYTLFVYRFGFGRCILSSSIALGIMIFPFIERRCEKTFNEISKDYIISSYNLGFSKCFTFFHIILPISLKEIIANLLIAFSFSMGALAPMIFTGAVAFSPIPDSIFKPSMALPMHLYLMISQGETSLDKAYATAFVELILLLICAFSSYLLTLRSKNNE